MDERSGTVWVVNTTSGPPPGAFIPREDYERGVRSEPAGDALVRVDTRTNRVVAEVPIENTAIEGGASSVAVSEDAV